MRQEALTFECKHYQSRVTHFQEEISEKTKELELKMESLKILQELHRKLDFNPSILIIQGDIDMCEKEISDLKSEIRYCQSNLKTFEKIVEKLYAIS